MKKIHLCVGIFCINSFFISFLVLGKLSPLDCFNLLFGLVNLGFWFKWKKRERIERNIRTAEKYTDHTIPFDTDNITRLRPGTLFHVNWDNDSRIRFGFDPSYTPLSATEAQIKQAEEAEKKRKELEPAFPITNDQPFQFFKDNLETVPKDMVKNRIKEIKIKKSTEEIDEAMMALRREFEARAMANSGAFALAGGLGASLWASQNRRAVRSFNQHSQIGGAQS